MVLTSHFRVSRKLLALLMPVALVLAYLGPPTVAAVAPKALINGATVVGSPSLEEQAAVAAGFTVAVVTDTAWAALTAADFGQYDLLIAGDPNCGTLPPGLVASAPVWGPVVLGTAGGRTLAGNRVVIGTDPVLHQGTGQAKVLINEGIAFAGKQPGRTGMYLDTTCAANYFGQSAETLVVVNAISSPAASGAWTVDALPPCGGAVSLIASVPGSFPTLTTAGLQGWICSVHESFPTFKSDFAALAVATDTTTHPTCGVDPATTLSACGEAYVLIAGSGIIIVSGSISLTPLDVTNPVGTDHTVTAHVSNASGPLVGQVVTFSVTGVNAGATGTCVPVTCASNASGDVTFTYHDTNGAGDDTIKASFTDAAGSLQSATAQKHWTSTGGDIATTVTYTGPTSVQYSDPLTMSGHLTDGTNPIAGEPLDFTFGVTHSPSVANTDASGNASAAAFNVTATPGPVPNAVDFAGDAAKHLLPSTTSGTIAVLKEDCTLGYTGDTLLSDSSMTNLKAQFGELDTTHGDWTGKLVTFTVTGSAGNVQTFTATTDASGLAATTAALSSDVFSVSVAFAGDAFYLPCATAANTIVTVMAANAKITGGGWISLAAGRTSFGFNVISDVTGLRGQLQVNVKGTKNKFHGNRVLSLVATANTGTWSGTGRWNGADGYRFTVSVVDNGTSGKNGDTISIVIMNPANAIVFTTGGPQPLKGGNIVVH
ncbi:MAG TPA: post-COAP-1 domain-containing protein [Candidatus Limnocylindrales bacterium]|jgi:hypothetical protein